MVKHWYQSEEDRMKDYYQWMEDPSYGRTSTRPVQPIETAENRHRRHYDLSVQFCGAVDEFLAKDIDSITMGRILRMKTPLPQYALLCPHNGR